MPVPDDAPPFGASAVDLEAIEQAALDYMEGWFAGDDIRMRMAEDHRPPGADVIDVAVTVDVDQVGALGALDERRRTAHPGERAYR